MMVTCDENCIGWIRVCISALTLISVVIAYLTFRANQSRERDKEYASQFNTSLEWSFNVLTSNGQNIPPQADSTNWSAAARHILRARKIRALITHPTYTLIADELEEYWRHKYYLAINDTALSERRYFMKEDVPIWPENIEVNAALIVIEFSIWWKRESRDSVYFADRTELKGHIDEHGGGLAGHGLIKYIDHLNSIRSDKYGV